MKIRILLTAAAALLSNSAFAEDASTFAGYYGGATLHLGKTKDVAYDAWYDLGEGWIDRNFQMEKPAVGLFGGYNHEVSGFLVGIEASLRADTSSQDTAATESYKTNYVWPDIGDEVNELVTSGETGVAKIDIGPYRAGTTTKSWTDYRETASPMISARVGAAFGDVMIYGRGGLGASVLSVRRHTTSTDTNCLAGITEVEYSPLHASWGQPTCVATSLSESATATSKTSRVAPSVSAAIGAEYNYGKYFARAEAEVSHIYWGSDLFPNGDSGATKYQLGLGVGIRF
ncbi:outer membrane beta-barrel protein [Mesorhizobium sp. DCY119]|uniref:outer membrane beta-barrel protein n=1 Tax=Mesorhizobium sp. DCY119 TaxID=2108445 RepID=UPI0010583E56|nr:outer membrane beta-barrel protein [Mesorhizobium sp. DCY119]